MAVLTNSHAFTWAGPVYRCQRCGAGVPYASWGEPRPPGPHLTCYCRAVVGFVGGHHLEEIEAPPAMPDDVAELVDLDVFKERLRLLARARAAGNVDKFHGMQEWEEADAEWCQYSVWVRGGGWVVRSNWSLAWHELERTQGHLRAAAWRGIVDREIHKLS